ncbi:MAG TPA: amino acid permease, partial [Gemmataceae bacterium]|nr:amino acid permease [Gemmataceae bacterium]
MWNQLFARKSLERLHAEMQDDNRLRRVLGPVGLTALGIGAIIGSGIFVTTGEAAVTKAGPSVMLAYIVAGLGCALAALCYAEFASMAPVAGSAYTYAYATLGELMAWIIGWDLILEYAMSCAVIAADWTKYFNEFIEVVFGKDWRVPAWLSTDAFTLMKDDPRFWVNVPGTVLEKFAMFPNPQHWPFHGFNVLAVAIMAACTALLIVGIRESATTNAVLVAVKVGVVLFVIGLGIRYITPANWTSVPVENRKTTDMGEYFRLHPDIADIVTANKRDSIDGSAFLKLLPDHPEVAKLISEDEKSDIREMASVESKWGAMSLLGFNHYLEPIDERVRSPFMPYGLSGIMVAAAAVFFAYLGFDAISTHSEEAKKPQRDVPIGILASLAICTVLYFAVSAVITGMEPYPTIDKDASVAVAFKRLANNNPNSWSLRASAVLI